LNNKPSKLHLKKTLNFNNPHLFLIRNTNFVPQRTPMKSKTLIIFLFSLLAISCQDDTAKRLAEQQRDLKKKEAVFTVVEKAWNFNEPTLTPEARAVVNNWSEWRLFLTELRQKPKSSIAAFQKKAKELSKRVTALNTNMPAKFEKPEIKSRIAALATKVKSLDLFINLDEIPSEKVIAQITDINIELASVCRQMQELVEREKVPLEQGESDMIKMLDTTRAIPSKPIK